jgi:hypothetical protein
MYLKPGLCGMSRDLGRSGMLNAVHIDSPCASWKGSPKPNGTHSAGSSASNGRNAARNVALSASNDFSHTRLARIAVGISAGLVRGRSRIGSCLENGGAWPINSIVAPGTSRRKSGLLGRQHDEVAGVLSRSAFSFQNSIDDSQSAKNISGLIRFGHASLANSGYQSNVVSPLPPDS